MAKKAKAAKSGGAKKPDKAKKPATKAAKAGAAKEKTAQRSQAAGVNRDTKQINATDLARLINRCKSLQKQAAENTGEIGKMVAQAVDGKNLDRVAFSMVRRLDRMSTPKLATTMACLRYYIDALELDERVDKEPGLPIPRQEAGEEYAGDEAQAGGDEDGRDVRPGFLQGDAADAPLSKH